MAAKPERVSVASFLRPSIGSRVGGGVMRLPARPAQIRRWRPTTVAHHLLRVVLPWARRHSHLHAPPTPLLPRLASLLTGRPKDVTFCLALLTEPRTAVAPLHRSLPPALVFAECTLAGSISVWSRTLMQDRHFQLGGPSCEFTSKPGYPKSPSSRKGTSKI